MVGQSLCAVFMSMGRASVARRTFGGDLAFELDEQGCIANYDKMIDYFPGERRAIFGTTDGLTPADIITFAADFEIKYMQTYKVVRNLRSGGIFVLRQCGTPAALPDLPLYAVDAPVFEVPVQRWSTGGTIAVSFLEEIGLGAKAVLVDPTWVTSPCMQKLVGCGATSSWERGTAVAAGHTWPREVARSGSQLNLIDRWGTGGTGSAVDVTFDASSDPSMLGRAEWLKFAAAFFNREAEANRIFKRIKTDFDGVVAAVAAARAGGAASPRVGFVSHTPSSTWTPQEQWHISASPYQLEAIGLAGGTSLDASSCPDDNPDDYKYVCAGQPVMDAVLRTLDVVIDESYPDGGDVSHTRGGCYFPDERWVGMGWVGMGWDGTDWDRLGQNRDWLAEARSPACCLDCIACGYACVLTRGRVGSSAATLPDCPTLPHGPTLPHVPTLPHAVPHDDRCPPRLAVRLVQREFIPPPLWAVRRRRLSLPRPATALPHRSHPLPRRWHTGLRLLRVRNPTRGRFPR